MTEAPIIPAGIVGLPPTPMAVDTTQRTKSDGPRRQSRRHAVQRRIALLNAFLDRAMPNLRRGSIAVWLLLYRHAAPDGTASASIGDLANRCGCSPRTVRYAVENLIRIGALSRLKRGSLSGGPSVYRLLSPEP
jgi:hypothetical protein